jgi:epoxyqueuosine reductase
MLQALVKKRAAEIGFDLVGIAPVDAWDGLKFSREWVKRGFGGEMRYLENPKRDDPRRILPSAQSVICVGLTYNAPFPYSIEVRNLKSEVRSKTGENTRPQGKHDQPALHSESETSHLPLATNHASDVRDHGWISRYAWGTDYHKIMRSKLEELRHAVERMAPGAETRAFVDTGPVVERALARLSGIGWAGKNTCLINESKGSWFFLGVMLTSLALEPDMPAPDRCGTCTACLDACPTQALVEPYVMDASRCIAYFNIELKGAIPEEFRPGIGANVVGCDICQDVCPWNKKGRSQESEVRSQKTEDGSKNVVVGRRVATTTMPEFQPMQVSVESGFAEAESRTPNPQPLTFSLFSPLIESLASLSEDNFRRIFRKSPIKRVKYRGWLRNLCVVMGNSGERKFLPRLQYFREHADPMVREHAEWAIQQIMKANLPPPGNHPTHVAFSS